jgi:hypothetical protein
MIVLSDDGVVELAPRLGKRLVRVHTQAGDQYLGGWPAPGGMTRPLTAEVAGEGRVAALSGSCVAEQFSRGGGLM